MSNAIEEFIGKNEYHLEAAPWIADYQRWMRKHDKPVEQITLDYQPLFSIVVPVYNTADDQLRAAIDSVIAQTYDKYELILVDDHSTWESIVPILKSYESDPHVKVILREKNGNISEATNTGIDAAAGEFLVFMDCDDTLAPDALYEVAKKLNEEPELDFIYTDEDKITEDGKIRHMPFFKPDWSPNLYWCENYTNHLSVYRMSIVRKTGGLRTPYNGSQDYDFVLRFMEFTSNSRVGHIPKILYHWRERKESVAFEIGAKNYASIAAENAKIDALKRRGIAGKTEFIEGIAQYRIVFEPVGNPLVSIVIPSKDQPEILKQCIDSIRDLTDYPNYEIIVVDNGSNDENHAVIAEYLNPRDCTYLYGKYAFNFSFMCNKGASEAKGEYILFLNDDIEIIQKDWLSRMVGQALQQDVGTVGAKLYYPDSTLIQHAGCYCSPDGPDHDFKMMDDKEIMYFAMNRVDFDCSCVTGACLLIGKKLFDDIGGFNEKLAVAYNDVDLCFRVMEHGYYNVVRQDVTAYHHESLSRGNDHVDEAKFLRLSAELIDLFAKHPRFNGKDPFINPNFKKYEKHWILYNDNTDEVSEYIDVAASPIQYVSIDSVNNIEWIEVRGWSFIPDIDNLSCSRYLLIEDPYGKKYKAPVCSIRRQDVEENMDNRIETYMCGFECRLDRNVIHNDIVPYKYGLLTVDKDGNNYVYWMDSFTNNQRNALLRVRKRYCKYEDVKDFEFKACALPVRSSLDILQRDDDGIYIKGWGFINEDEHFRYNKSVMLVAEDSAREFEINEEERSDVALAIPERKFICKTGYECRISDTLLDPDVTYKAYLRFRNCFDKSDINDVEIGTI